MQQFIQWGGLTPEQFRAKQQHEIMEARISQAMMASVGASGTSSETSTIQFLVQAYNQGTNLEFTFNVEASSSTTATINWGNGVVNDNLLVDLGMTTFSNVYAQDGDYTVSVTFADPSVITELDFPGMD
jgi:hypothetical protein